jgi:VanZ like family
MHSRTTWIAWAALGAISGFGMALAAWLLIAPDIGPPPAFPYQDKVFHLIAFGCLTGPAVLALPRPYLWFWLSHMVALGAGIEVVQSRMGKGRSGDPLDFVADCVGIALAYLIARLIRRFFESRAPAVSEETLH